MYEEEIKPHRQQIDRLNDEILEKIAHRQQAALAIAEIKKRYGKPVRDPEREKTILTRIREKAEAKNLDGEAAKRVFKEIIRLCVEAEEKL